MCYILFCSYLPQKKNDRIVIPYSLNPEGPLGSHLYDVIPPALLIKCQFSMEEKVNRIFLRVKEIFVFFLFLQLKL